MGKSYTKRQLTLPMRGNWILSAIFVWAITVCSQPVLCDGEPLLPAIKYGVKKELAPGVWHQHASDKSVPWEIEIIEIDLDSPDIEVVPIDAITPSKREKLPELANRGRAIAAINASFFNMKTGDSVNHFELDNVIHVYNRADLPARTTMGFTDGDAQKAIMTIVDPKGVPASHAMEWRQVVHAIGGGPGLIAGGEFTVTKNHEGFGKVNFIEKRHPRTAMGFNSKSKRMFWVTVDGRQPEWSVGMNLIELTHLFADLGCDNAMNFDGGGSTTCVANGKVINRVSNKEGKLRAVSNAWIVRRTLPEIIVDNDTSDASKTGQWSSTSENGCYGDNVLIHVANSPDEQPASVTWSPTVPAPGEYLVEAWWVASPDRTHSAKFSLHQGDSTNEFVVDQREFGGRWNPLGRLVIRQDGTPTINLKYAGQPSGSISADAIRLTRLGPSLPQR
ncbi:MAG: hypothetical protein DHS20C16_15440 [Phycisphaerae bacterium]|nr:MAG: hypothetical protein DHS20C16_15440 [Phycisphaerae bacterium]